MFSRPLRGLRGRWTLGLLAALALSGSSAAGDSRDGGTGPAAEPLADKNARGWHGEPLPPGMERGLRDGEYLWTRDRSVMVYVPAGPFPMGRATGPADERPVHEVVLSAYYIDKTETSWRQWKLSGLPYAESPDDPRAIPRAPDWGIHDDQPVVNVTWADARAYARWAGKRLPSEAEWEKAARGVDGRSYPWGDEAPSYQRAVYRGHPAAEASTAPVDCCAAGASPYGVLNLAGNVYEWCEDVYQRDFYARSPSRDPLARGDGPHRVLRGGAHVLEAEDLRSTLRYRLRTGDRTPYIGFRTVVSGIAEAAP